VRRLLPGIAAGILYLAAALALIIAVDTDYEADHGVWLAIFASASLVFGWITGSWRAGLLALVLVPLAALFGYPESRFSEPFPIWATAVLYTPISVALILIGVGAQKVSGRYASASRREDASDP
jgi:hypothetical protein